MAHSTSHVRVKSFYFDNLAVYTVHPVCHKNIHFIFSPSLTGYLDVHARVDVPAYDGGCML